VPQGTRFYAGSPYFSCAKIKGEVMNTELVDRLKNILITEKRLNCTNSSVYGGFTNFIEREARQWLAQFDEQSITPPIIDTRPYWQRLIELAQVYLEVPPAHRLTKLEEMERIVGLIQMSSPGNETRVNSGENPSNQTVGFQAGYLSELLPPKKNYPDQVNSYHDPSGTNIQFLRGVGPQRGKLLNRLGIKTVFDLLRYYPRDYEDRTQVPLLKDVRPGERPVTVIGTVQAVSRIQTSSKVVVIKVLLVDQSGSLNAVWFNQPYFMRNIKPGQKLLVTGKIVPALKGGWEIQVREYEQFDETAAQSNSQIVPVYTATDGLPSRILRSLVQRALPDFLNRLPETLPEEILNRHGLLPLTEALSQIHFPSNCQMLEAARRRLCFEELFFFQLGLALLGKGRRTQAGYAHRVDPERLHLFSRSLGFCLTPAQQRVLSEILADMHRPVAMSRLLQGDVGSGKTVIAAAALVVTVSNGLQGALMVPTEILAEQHQQTLAQMLAPLQIPVVLLKGGQPRAERRSIEAGLKAGTIPVVVGTQALIQEGIEFQQLGLVVIDEQHRFGVRQRVKLQQKGKAPDLLVMTATPIPRTLALTLYGDLDLSILDESPPGRKPVRTYVVNESYRLRLNRFVREQVQLGRQAYYVCPLVEESESLDLEAASSLAVDLQEKAFPDLRIGLVHGRLRPDEKEQVMKAFRLGEIDILVSTTVVEVGVNVPNATVMVIEGAERFGLAQLHQLRGRVGRSEHQAYCILVSQNTYPEARQRLAVMAGTNNGFVIAEEDLKIRGPGEFFGLKQHGLPNLKLANLVRDYKLLEIARAEAQALIKTDPDLERSDYQKLYLLARESLGGLDIPRN
jgi:ATP-dependent DNA helicase RecG